jgi:molybdopterin-containing oxidoreductase family iron-sulfur binding subunit
VLLTLQERSVAAPIWVLPGQADDTVTIHLGYGGSGTQLQDGQGGFNAYDLRTTAAMWHSAGVSIAPTGERYPLACSQDHHYMRGRNLVRRADAKHFEGHPDFARDAARETPRELTLYDDEAHKSDGYAWGMAIDLNACIGCHACSLACQAENSIPVVGKEEVLLGREMSWIRIDRYFTDAEDPEILLQPIPCQQCEYAPCELVCPVGATSHSEEGLNDMIYNRCVGTRYCANNCPYKVRRFNFLQYVDRESETLKMQRNPDVTVRARGVMEKCTYCTQRINAARVEAKKRGEPIRDGEIQTACEQVCPSGAIVFGNINDADSEVARWKASPLSYGILTELNTRPRTTYLARVTNPSG